MLYRWSLKATSIIYAPLVFVAHSTFSEGTDLRTKLEPIKRGDLSRIRVLYGVAAIAAFLVKLVLMVKWSGFAAWWNGNPITEFLAVYVAPAEIPKWQVAQFANSALAIGAILFARHALLRYELGHPFPDAPGKRILGFVSGLRWVLALYAIVCTGYITMRAARDWHLPALGEKWIPWQQNRGPEVVRLPCDGSASSFAACPSRWKLTKRRSSRCRWDRESVSGTCRLSWPAAITRKAG